MGWQHRAADGRGGDRAGRAHDASGGGRRAGGPVGSGPTLSRRELLKRAGVAGAAAAVPPELLAPVARQVPDRDTQEVLTPDQRATLEAVVARLIPTDESGPGAAEANAAGYIDRALGGALATDAEAYALGLAALDRLAEATKGAKFTQLAAGDQDALLGEMESGSAAGFPSGSATFFELLRTHAIQGTFCDPAYGGNAGFVGWDLIRYPGVRTAVTSAHQRMDVAPTPARRSAYEFSLFADERPTRGR